MQIPDLPPPDDSYEGEDLPLDQRMRKAEGEQLELFPDYLEEMEQKKLRRLIRLLYS